MNVEGHVFKRVTHFKYLGHLITQDNDLLGYKKATKVFLVLEKY